MARFDRLNNQAPAQIQLEKNTSPVGRSAHDFSYIHSGNALFGAVIPVDCFDVVPNEDLQINLAALLEFRNPTTRQLLNSCRVYFHAYYNRLTDLWEGARNWIDKGRSGKIDLSRPNLIYTASCQASVSSPTVSVNACTPMSLLNFLGLPAQCQQGVIESSSSLKRIPLRQFQPALNASDSSFTFTKLSDTPDFFPADCCMAYQRNWRDFYSSKNLLQNNKAWFPDNEDHFILSYSCENAICIKYGDEDLKSYDVQGQPYWDLRKVESISGNPNRQPYSNGYTPETSNPSSIVSDIDFDVGTFFPNLSGLKFRQFRGDRFTSALPFPDLIRGDIPILELTSDSVQHVYGTSTVPDTEFERIGQNNAVGSNPNAIYGVYTDPQTQDESETLFNVDLPGSSITMSDIYTLETLTAFKRRMAMTNGDYNEMIEAQFGVNPKVHDRHGTYIGGYYQDFVFNSVTQTSESAGTPLGTKAGQGVSNGSGSIGQFHVPDYGWIQIYMSIVPDVMYTQGKPRMFSKKSNLEMYFPIFNNLPAQAIRNDELFISGNSTTDPAPYGYEDRYAEYKSRTNRVSGFMGLSHSVAALDAAKIMARRFSSAPALNSLFVTMVPENIDMEVFTVVDEPPIDFSVGVSVRRVFPGPYTAIEGSLSSPALMR